MAIYIMPIFCFGLVISGIIYLGIRQAADVAKQLAEDETRLEPVSRDPQFVSPGRNAAPVKPPTIWNSL